MFNIKNPTYPAAINFLMVLYAAALPLGHALANIVMALIGAAFVFDLLLKKKGHIKFDKKRVLMLLSFGALFLLYLVGLIYTDNIQEGIRAVAKKVSLFVFPLVLLSSKEIIPPRAIIISIKAFTVSLIIVCLGSIILAAYNCYDISRFEVLQYCLTDQNLAEAFISYHKLYLALYISIGVFFILYLYFWEKTVLFNKGVTIFALLFFIGFLFLLGGRTSVAITIALLLIMPFFFWAKARKYTTIGIYGLLILGVLGGSIAFNTPFRDKVKEAINYGNSYDIDKKWGGASVRKLIWKYAFETVKKNPLLGSGTGDTKQQLEESYLLCTESAALKGNNYNAHNDLLQITVAVGALGLFLFVFSIVFILSSSIKHNNWPHVLFLVIILLSGLTESLFERDMGIRIFAFFSVLLFINSKNENTSDT